MYQTALYNEATNFHSAIKRGNETAALTTWNTTPGQAVQLRTSGPLLPVSFRLPLNATRPKVKVHRILRP